MELLRLLHVQLTKRSVGTLVLGQRTLFREIFFEKEHVYLCGGQYSGRVDLGSLVDVGLLGRRFSLPELDRLVGQADLTRELLPVLLRSQNLISPSEEQELLERHVKEEILDLLLENADSFHFLPDRVPEQLLGAPTPASSVAVPIADLVQHIASRQRELAELAALFPSREEILVKTEEGLAASQSESTAPALARILVLADGLRDLTAIIASSAFYRYYALRNLGDALEREYLKKTVLAEVKELDPDTLGFDAARDALKICRRAVKHAMDPVAVRETIARIHEKLGEEESAIVQYNFIGDAFYRMAQPARAIEVFQRILELRPNDAMATQKIVRVYRDSAENELARGNAEGAVKLYESAFSARPDDEATLQRLARILIDNGWQADLPELCDRAIAHAKRTGEMEIAVRACRTVIEARPDDVVLHKKLVNAFLAFDRFELAAEAMADLARAFHRRGQKSRALDLAEKIRRLRADSSEVQRVWRGLSRELGATETKGRSRYVAAGVVTAILVFTSYQAWTYHLWREVEGESIAFADSLEESDGAPQASDLSPDPRIVRLRAFAERCDRFVTSYPVSLFRPRAASHASRALRAADAIEARQREAAEELVDRAVRLLREGRTDEIPAVLEPLALRPESDPARIRAAAVFAEARGRSRSAASLLEEARGREKQGDWTGANHLYRRVLDDFPESTAAKEIKLPVYLDSLPTGVEVVRIGRGREEQILGHTPLVVRLVPGDVLDAELRSPSCWPLELHLDALAQGPPELALEQRMAWNQEIDGKASSATTLEGNLLLVPDGLGAVHAFDLDRRQALWTLRRERIHSLVGAPAVAPEGIYLVWNDHRVMLVDPAASTRGDRSPEIKANATLSGLASTGALPRADGSLIVGTSRRRLAIFMRGFLDPRGEIALERTPRAIAVLDERTVIIADDSNTVSALDPRTGKIRWRQSLVSALSGPLRVGEHRIFAPLAPSGIAVLDRQSGAVREPWRPGADRAIALDSRREIVYRLRGSGTIEAVTLVDSAVVRKRALPVEIESLALAGGRLIAIHRGATSSLVLDPDSLATLTAVRTGFAAETWISSSRHLLAIGSGQNGNGIRLASFELPEPLPPR